MRVGGREGGSQGGMEGGWVIYFTTYLRRPMRVLEPST